jgi:hypothetical protein
MEGAGWWMKEKQVARRIRVICAEETLASERKRQL